MNVPHVLDVNIFHVSASVNGVTETEMRRRPGQARSRARVDTILRATAELIAEQGIDPPSMTEIAERAGMGVTALYRYFPNKAAIIRALAVAVQERDRAALVTPATGSEASPAELIRTNIAAYWRLHRDEPYRLHLRAAILADAELRELDLADTRRNAEILTGYLAAVTDRRDLGAMERQVLLVLSLLDGLIATAAQLDEREAELLVDDFTTMASGLLLG